MRFGESIVLGTRGAQQHVARHLKMLPTPRVAATDPALRVQQLDLLYSTLPFSLASSLGLATLATVPLWSVVPHLNVALWLAAHVALTFGRILAWRRWKLGSVELQ